ncbi:M57 family metalloprotease [Aquimarina sp. RZ0]|uniref:M57 family metalloprotease n=1 Tax=Aquimarina sp. RZ0 TaxID=2607730 RepID=UPI0011F0D3B3|nr:M57 family metalloprotease [Aquimarina sp. RZ0]KAA1247303.1 hypothetical protein F0000_03925 [Aquimarina sp. RZ0]
MKVLKKKSETNIVHSLKIIVFIVSMGLLFSCETEEFSQQEEIPLSGLTKQEQIDVAKLGFRPGETEKIKVKGADGVTKDYYLYSDMKVPVSALKDLIAYADESLSKDESFKLTRTYNTAAGNRRYNVVFVGFEPGFQRQAAGDMIWLFNNVLRTTIRLDIKFVNNQQQLENTPRDIYIDIRNLGGDIFAISDVPFRSKPGERISINRKKMNKMSTRANLREVLMHEILHTFGMNHSDWRTNRSCGVNIADPSIETIGAVPIGGANASGNNLDSIMLACGELVGRGFMPDDIASMRGVYGFK